MVPCGITIGKSSKNSCKTAIRTIRKCGGGEITGEKTTNKDEFYRLVKITGLDKYNISDSEESRYAANVIGIMEDNGYWVVFETDEKAVLHVLSKHASQGDAYNALFAELRNKKRREKIIKKLRKLR